MKFFKPLLYSSIGYYLVNIYFVFEFFNTPGGSRIVAYLLLVVFQLFSLFILALLAVIYYKKWRSTTIGKANQLLLLSYLILPILIYWLVS